MSALTITLEEIHQLNNMLDVSRQSSNSKIADRLVPDDRLVQKICTINQYIYNVQNHVQDNDKKAQEYFAELHKALQIHPQKSSDILKQITQLPLPPAAEQSSSSLAEDDVISISASNVSLSSSDLYSLRAANTASPFFSRSTSPSISAAVSSSSCQSPISLSKSDQSTQDTVRTKLRQLETIVEAARPKALEAKTQKIADQTALIGTKLKAKIQPANIDLWDKIKLVLLIFFSAFYLILLIAFIAAVIIL